MASSLILCKTCKKEMAKSAKVCPNCGAKNKKPLFTRWWFIVIVVIVLFSIIGAANGNNNKAALSTTTVAGAGITTAAVVDSTSATTVAATEQSFKIGDAVEYKGIRLTVLKVENSEGSKYNKPDTGNVFLHIYLKIENIGDEKLSVSPLDYKLQTSNGQLLSYDLMATIDVEKNQLASLELMKGGSVEGIVGFTAPVGDTGLILHYYDNFFNEEPSILINLK